MRVIEVRELNLETVCPGMPEVSARLDELGKGHRIDRINWKDFDYKPEARFNIAYGTEEIYIKYYIREKGTKAEKSRTNEMVCEDSCVEFFVSPAEDGIYYNIESNPIGTILMGSGHGRHDSVMADSGIVDNIRRLTTMGSQPFAEIKGDISWSLTLAIPLKTFFRHNIDRIKGKSFRANFYKCGDKLSVPHYVTWNEVKTEKPDYHRPEFFGILKFI